MPVITNTPSAQRYATLRKKLKYEYRNPKQIQILEFRNSKLLFGHSDFEL